VLGLGAVGADESHPPAARTADTMSSGKRRNDLAMDTDPQWRNRRVMPSETDEAGRFAQGASRPGLRWKRYGPAMAATGGSRFRQGEDVSTVSSR